MAVASLALTPAEKLAQLYAWLGSYEAVGQLIGTSRTQVFNWIKTPPRFHEKTAARIDAGWQVARVAAELADGDPERFRELLLRLPLVADGTKPLAHLVQHGSVEEAVAVVTELLSSASAHESPLATPATPTTTPTRQRPAAREELLATVEDNLTRLGRGEPLDEEYAFLARLGPEQAVQFRANAEQLLARRTLTQGGWQGFLDDEARKALDHLAARPLEPRVDADEPTAEPPALFSLDELALPRAPGAIAAPLPLSAD
jgi:hypothetical protein